MLYCHVPRNALPIHPFKHFAVGRTIQPRCTAAETDGWTLDRETDKRHDDANSRSSAKMFKLKICKKYKSSLSQNSQFWQHIHTLMLIVAAFNFYLTGEFLWNYFRVCWDRQMWTFSINAAGIFTGQIPFLLHNSQHQSTEAYVKSLSFMLNMLNSNDKIECNSHQSVHRGNTADNHTWLQHCSLTSTHISHTGLMAIL